MYSIKASLFKAKCLALMDQVNENNEEIVITKNGKPVSKLVPYRKSVDSLFGLHSGRLAIKDDLIRPIDESWDVDK